MLTAQLHCFGQLRRVIRSAASATFLLHSSITRELSVSLPPWHHGHVPLLPSLYLSTSRTHGHHVVSGRPARVGPRRAMSGAARAPRSTDVNYPMPIRTALGAKVHGLTRNWTGRSHIHIMHSMFACTACMIFRFLKHLVKFRNWRSKVPLDSL